jgi:catechol 2,3-dioxygenase-like lactoylglutathione lyase family enzyme
VRGTHHVEIFVSDLEASLEFWGWLLPELGFELYQQWDEGCSYKAGDHYLVFVQAEPAYRDAGYHRKRPGLNHLALWATSTEQVKALPELLRARGVPVLYEDRDEDGGAPSDWSVFFEDPDRIKVEVVSPD